MFLYNNIYKNYLVPRVLPFPLKGLNTSSFVLVTFLFKEVLIDDIILGFGFINGSISISNSSISSIETFDSGLHYNTDNEIVLLP